MNITSHFFVGGGTLPWNAPCYVKRPADDQLLQLIKQGQFCYVLTARQMGKSSLIGPTRTRLKKLDVSTAIIDLTRIGTVTITVDQWYLGLLIKIAEELHLSTEPITWWQDHAALGQVQRFDNFLRHVVLKEIKGQIVIFIDEIDITLNLDFRDDFFAVIRAIYNARANQPEFERLTFVLLGVASPTDLIKDHTRSPFNIGQRLVLEEFTDTETIVFQEQLEAIYPSQGEAIFERIYYWTSGHPYLTQMLCLTVANDHKENWNDQEIDALVQKLFLSKTARGQDSNLQFVQRRIQDYSRKGQLLSLYEEVHKGDKIKDDPQSPIQNELKLAGLVKVVDGYLQIRNQIYREVFDLAWVRENNKSTSSLVANGTLLLNNTSDVNKMGFQEKLEATSSNHDLNQVEQNTKSNSTPIWAIALVVGLLAVVAVIWNVLTSVNLASLASVSNSTQFPTVLQSPTATQSPTEVFPEALQPITTPTNSATPSPTSSPPETAPSATPSTTPTPPAISPSNATQVKELARWGKGEVNGVAYSPNGERFAIASSLGIYLYDAETREQENFIETESEITSVAFNPVEEKLQLVLGFADGKVQLWDISSGQELLLLQRHTQKVNSVAFSPNGTMIASGSTDGIVQLWKGLSKEPLPLGGHTSSVNSVVFSPDGQTVISGSDDETVRFWSVNDGSEQKKLTEPTNRVSSVAVSSDGQILAFGSADGIVYLWQLPEDQLLKTLEESNIAEVSSITFSLDGQQLVSGYGDGNLLLWQVWENKPPEELERHNNKVHSVAFSPDGDIIASASLNNTVQLWQVSDSSFKMLPGYMGNVLTVAFSPDGKLVASGSDDNQVRVWRVTDDTLVHTLEHNGPVTSVAFSLDGQMLASGSQDRTIKLWQVNETLLNPLGTDEDVESLPLLNKFETNRYVESVAFSADGQTVASASRNNTVQLWRVQDGQNQSPQTLTGHTDWVYSVAFSGSTLVSGSLDETIRFSQINNDESINSSYYKVSQGIVWSVALSADGKMLASGSGGGIIHLWKVNNGNILDNPQWKSELPKDKINPNHVHSVAFGPDGQLLVSGSRDNTVRLWRVSDGKLRKTLEGHRSWVYSVGFSPDGKLLVSGSDDGTIRLWGVEP